MLVPKAEETRPRSWRSLTSLVTLGVGIGILAEFNYDRAGILQFRVNEPWIDVINARYHIGLDGISLPMLILSMVITVLCIIYSWNHFPEPHNPKGFLALILLLEVGMNGTFVAQDLILFFIFFEIVLLPMFFMIGVWGGPNREYASIKFFLFTLFGSALMLLSFLALFFLAGARSRSRALRRAWATATSRETTQPADLRRPVPRLRDQGADVPVPHLAAGRAHRGADRRLGAAGRDPAEARHLRVHPHRDPDPARRPRRRGRRGSALLAVIGIIYGALVLSRADRHEAADRVLVGRAHGLRDARHRDAHRRSASTPRSSAWSRTVSSPACCSSSPARCSTTTAPAR